MTTPYRAAERTRRVIVETRNPRAIVAAVVCGAIAASGAIVYLGFGNPLVWFMFAIFALLAIAGTHHLRIEIDREGGSLRWSHRFIGIPVQRRGRALTDVRDVVVVVERVVNGEDGPFDAHAIYVRTVKDEWLRMVGQLSTYDHVQFDLARRVRAAAALPDDVPLVIRAKGV